MAIKKEIDRDYYVYLSLNEGAYFFEKGDAVINKTAISKLFDNVADGTKVLERQYRIKENGFVHEGDALCSLLVFIYNADPTFVNYGHNPLPQELEERKVGFM